MEKLCFNPQILAIVTGIPGSGKTTLLTGYEHHGIKIGDGVVDFIHAAYIDKDMIADGFTRERAGEFYESVRKGVYSAIDNLVIGNLRLGSSILIDAPYSTEVQNPRWADRYKIMTEIIDAKLKLIRCIAPEDVIRKRLEERGYERDRDKISNWKEFLDREPIHVPIPYDGIEIDTSNTLEENVKSVLNFLRE